jgi:hypothetical protein
VEVEVVVRSAVTTMRTRMRMMMRMMAMIAMMTTIARGCLRALRVGRPSVTPP